jgi:PleD family two-component response regulator
LEADGDTENALIQVQNFAHETGGDVMTDKVFTKEEFLTALEETKPKPHSMIINKIDPNLDRFVTIEEMQSKLREHQFAVAYYVILEDALSNGDFVLYNGGPPPTYRIVRKGQPGIMSMRQ